MLISIKQQSDETSEQ